MRLLSQSLTGWCPGGSDEARKDETGMAKLKQKHLIDLERLPETLVHGKIDGVRYNNKAGEDFRENARAIISGDYFAIVSRKSDGRWKIDTHYKDKKTVGTIKALSK